MFNSGIAVKDLIEDLKTEVDIALEIPDTTYITWLNSLQQLLYSEVIKEEKEEAVDAYMMHYSPAVGKPDELVKLNPVSLNAGIRFEDICAVYHNETQLKKSTLASGEIFPNTYFKNGNGLGYNVKDETPTLKIVYYVRPALVKIDDADYDNTNVMIPIEFIDLAKAKLRGEAYKLANEDALAAKWLNDYNTLLETFKAWIADKSPNFGI